MGFREGEKAGPTSWILGGDTLQGAQSDLECFVHAVDEITTPGAVTVSQKIKREAAKREELRRLDGSLAND